MRTFAFALAFLAPTVTIAAPSTIAVDYTTGEVLSCERCERPMPPSSMSKLMTLEILFHELREGRLWLNRRLQVSRSAVASIRRDNEARLDLDAGDFVTVDDLIKGMIIQSAGDACLVIAETIGGSEAHFAELMNARAADLGLNDSHFVNARGLSQPGQTMSAHDIARLSAHLIRAYPEYYRYFGLTSFVFRGTRYTNRNGLLGNNGVDGMKTGHTIAGGFGLVATARRGGRRIIAVVNGQPSEEAREHAAARLIEAGFDAAREREAHAERFAR